MCVFESPCRKIYSCQYDFFSSLFFKVLYLFHDILGTAKIVSSTFLYRETKSTKTITASLDKNKLFCIYLSIFEFFEFGEVDSSSS